MARRLAAVAATVALVVGLSTVPAQAATTVEVVCGGLKSGTGWHTFPSGGYDGTSDGQPCRPPIDWIATPTRAQSAYIFLEQPYANYRIDAWIPTNSYATALMDFSIRMHTPVKEVEIDRTTINQSVHGGWGLGDHLGHHHGELALRGA